jgi:photosystem II stability/assembly factor-like uncharacterized protein
MLYGLAFLFGASGVGRADEVRADTSTASWLAPKAAQSLLLDIANVPGGRLVAVGERGHVLLSDDGGDTWKQVMVPTRATLTGVDFVSADKGWIVGHDAVILSTTDGGISWHKQYEAPDLEQPLFDVAFDSESHGLAVGAYGLMLETMDGGAHWHEVDLSSIEDPAFGLPHLYHLELLGDRDFMVGEAGTIAVQVLGEGATWKRMPVSYGGTFFSVKELKDGVLLAVGLRGHVFRSVDKGASWYEVETGTQSSFYDVAYDASSDTVAVVGADGALLVSFDNGRHFQRLRREDRESIDAVVWTPKGRLLGVGFGGVKDLTPLVVLAKSNSGNR